MSKAEHGASLKPPAPADALLICYHLVLGTRGICEGGSRKSNSAVEAGAYRPGERRLHHNHLSLPLHADAGLFPIPVLGRSAAFLVSSSRSGIFA